jgi:hypothetical protein
MPLNEVLAKLDLAPDLTFTHQGGKPSGPTPYPGGDLEFIHRRAFIDEIYFLSNQHAAPKSVVAKFRMTGKVPEVWMPDSGKIYRVPEAKTRGGHTEVPLRFGPGEAYFVVFRPASEAFATEPVPWLRPERLVTDLSRGWTVEFPGGATIEMPELTCWTELEDEALKYHSGTATYRKTFELPSPLATRHSPLALDLGRVEVIASVKVNGTDCGIAWKRPYRVEVTDALKAGRNTIEITVANLWVNRLIGDQRFPDDLEWTSETGSTAAGLGLAFIPEWVKSGGPRPEPRRKAFYAWKWPHMTADKALLPSGLLGPVRMLEIK